MPVPVMQIRQVRVRMRQRRMLVPVRMRLAAAVIVRAVRVLMVRVVHVAVAVAQRLVRVQMPVLFAQYQPRGERHQHQRRCEQNIHRFAEQQYRGAGADERAVLKCAVVRVRCPGGAGARG